jgi:hypothetical protein
VVLTGEGSGVTRASRARTSSTYHMYKWLNFAAARPIDRPIALVKLCKRSAAAAASAAAAEVDRF